MPGLATTANDNTNPLFLQKSVTLAPSGSLALTNGNLAASDATPTSPSVAVRATANNESLAASSLVVGASRMIAPWYRASVGHEMVVFDVSDAAAPRYAATVDARIGRTGDWSAPIAH